MTLSIRLLGTPEITVNSETVTLPGHKPLALFAFLLLNPQPHPRQALVDMLYDAAEDPRATLRWSLRQLRKRVGEAYFETNRRTIGINRNAPFWLDVTAFCDGEVTHYRGPFLQGVEVRDGHRFMDWLYIQRTRLAELAQRQLGGLLEERRQAGDHTAVIEIGHRLLQLDNLHEERYQALMKAYHSLGRKEAALKMYQTCQQVLQKELALQPSYETQQLYQQILQKPSQRHVSQTAVSAPQFPISLPKHTSRAAPFVARATQLAHLAHLFDCAKAGEGQVVFVSGSAGRGKSALVTHFAHERLTHEAAHIGIGSCDAFDGIGEAYAPFREVIDTLMGSYRWAVGEGLATVTEAEQYLKASHSALRALVNDAPILLNRLISVEQIRQRLGWIETPEARDTAVRLANLTEEHSEQNQQTHLFRQINTLLRTLSRQKPLVLILDDLQWCDHSSMALLFYLARRIRQESILIICTYRQQEMASRHTETGQPLFQLVNEIERLFGTRGIDLEQVEAAENGRFVHQLLERKYNQVAPIFEEELLNATHGHPLFVVELLNALQRQKQLVRDEKGLLTNKDPLVWQRLPRRMEAVVAMQYQNLPESLQELLSVAAVMGKRFSAQALARVVGQAARQTVNQLSQLENQPHYLLQNEGQEQVGNTVIDHFSFRHAFFHDHLLRQIGDSERRLLHGDIGEVLEQVYAGALETAVLPIATHFEQARVIHKAVYYFTLASQEAHKRFAYDEVIQRTTRALILLPEEEMRARYDVLAMREQALATLARREAQLADLSALRQVAFALDEAAIHADVALRHVSYQLATRESAIDEAKTAVSFAKISQNLKLEAQGELYLARALMAENRQKEATTHLQNCLHLSKEVQLERLEATSLRSFGELSQLDGELTQARSFYEQSLTLAYSAGHRFGQGQAAYHLGEVALIEGELSKAMQHLTAALLTFQRMKYLQGCVESLLRLGFVTAEMGDYFRARQYLNRGLTESQKMGSKHLQGMMLAQLGWVALCLDEKETAVYQIDKALELMDGLDDEETIGWISYWYGRILLGLNEDQATIAHFKQAANIIKLIPMCLAGQALAHWRLGERETAVQTSQKIWQMWQQHAFSGEQHPIWVLFTSYTICANEDASLANKFLSTVKELLLTRADQIEDEATRRLFLTRVPEHAHILTLSAD